MILQTFFKNKLLGLTHGGLWLMNITMIITSNQNTRNIKEKGTTDDLLFSCESSLRPNILQHINSIKKYSSTCLNKICKIKNSFIL